MIGALVVRVVVNTQRKEREEFMRESEKNTENFQQSHNYSHLLALRLLLYSMLNVLSTGLI